VTKPGLSFVLVYEYNFMMWYFMFLHFVDLVVVYLVSYQPRFILFLLLFSLL